MHQMALAGKEGNCERALLALWPIVHENDEFLTLEEKIMKESGRIDLYSSPLVASHGNYMTLGPLHT